MNPTGAVSTPVRFVALGDSQTEGLNDGDDHTGYAGWADRLAERIARNAADVLYANLAVRGRLAHQVRAQQLPAARALHPTLAAVSAGVNDVLRPSFDPVGVATELDAMFATLRADGCRVITMTFPVLAKPVPARRVIERRIDQLNGEIRRVAASRDVRVIDLAVQPAASDPRFWSWDRIHLNALGHQRVADAAAHTLELDDADDSWTRPLPTEITRATLWDRTRDDLHWSSAFLGPWVLRRIRRRSSGTGRDPKRPTMQRV